MAVTKRKLSYYNEKGIDELKDLPNAYIPALQSNVNNFKIPPKSFFDTFLTKEEITKIPNVEITSEDNSVKVTKNTVEQTNTKTFDLSVNVDNQLEYGQFRATNVTSHAQLTKIKGNLELNNYAIKLKKGNSYHFTVRGSYVATDKANTYSTITYIEYSSNTPIQVNVDNTITDSQFFEISYDVYNFSQNGNYNVSFASITGGKVSELWVEVHNLNGVSVNGQGPSFPAVVKTYHSDTPTRYTWNYTGVSSNYSKAAVTITGLEPNKLHTVEFSMLYDQNYAASYFMYVFASASESNMGVPTGYSRISTKLSEISNGMTRRLIVCSWTLNSSANGEIFINIVGNANPDNTTNTISLNNVNYTVTRLK